MQIIKSFLFYKKLLTFTAILCIIKTDVAKRMI